MAAKQFRLEHSLNRKFFQEATSRQKRRLSTYLKRGFRIHGFDGLECVTIHKGTRWFDITKTGRVIAS